MADFDDDGNLECLCLKGLKYFIVTGSDECGKSCNWSMFIVLQLKCISGNIFFSVLDDKVAYAWFDGKMEFVVM